MEIKIVDHKGINVAEVISDSVVIKTTQDALDLMADCGYQGADRIIIHERNLNPEFFDLKTKLAGDILQKFSTYRTRLAIIGTFSKYPSRSLRDFIYESNKSGQILFLENEEEAIDRIVK
jgi:hypothetical protein